MLLALTSSASAQDTTMRRRLDSLSVRMLVRRYPCPNPVPLGWVAADSTNGSGVRCSLIAAAARGLQDAIATRPTGELETRAVRCVTLRPGKPLPTVGPMWRVAFYSDSIRGAEVHIDAFDGHTVVVRVGVDLEEPISKACPKVTS